MFVGVGNSITILGRRFTVSGGGGGGGVTPPALDTLPTDLSGLLAWHSVASDTDLTINNLDRTSFAGWSATATTTTGSVSDPFGGTGAYNLIEDSTTANHGVTVASPAFGTGDFEIDIYVKPLAGSPKRWAMINAGTTTSGLCVDLDTGEFTQGSNCVGVSVTRVGVWWRIVAVFSRLSGTDTRVYINNAFSQSASSYAGSGGVGGFTLYIAYCRRKNVSQVNDKSGNGYHMTQATDGNRPILVDNPSLTSGSNRVVGCHVSTVTKTLVDHNNLVSRLSGSDTPFTVAWLGRYAGFATGESDGLTLVGSTARHRVLSATGSYAFIQQRTDDAAATKFANSSSLDFTPDTNWHATAIVFSGTGSNIWIDGQKSTSSFDLNVGACAFTSMSESFTSRMWRERAIYDRALSDSEVVSLQNGMRARAGLPTFSLENPLNVPGVQAWFESDMVLLSTASVNPDLTAWTSNDLTATGTGTFTLTEGTAAATTHYVLSPAATNAATGTYLFSVELKKATGGRQWVALAANNSTVALVYFDLDNGVIGTQNAGVVGQITSLGSGWYRCAIEYTISATNSRIYAAEADNDIIFTGSGTAAYEARNAQVTQYRVSSLMNKGPATWSLDQATATSQPFYFSGSYGALSATSGSLINGRPTIGENLNAAAESLASNASFSGIWSGNDRPASLIALVNRTANPGGTTNMMQWTGSPAVHQMMRITGTGQVEARRLDNASTTVNPTYATIATGTYSWSQIFTGQSESLYRDATQVGSTVNLDVGDATLGASLNFQPRATAFYGFCMANRELTSAERVGLENGFKKRAGLI